MRLIIQFDKKNNKVQTRNKYVLIYGGVVPANTTHEPDASKATEQRIRCLPVSKPEPAQRLLFAGV